MAGAGDPYITSGYQNITRNVAPNFDDSTWTSHGYELPFVFGNAGPSILVSTPLSAEIMSRWANFARFGDPNPRVSPSSTELLYAMWEPVSNDVSATNNEEASDTRYLYLTVDGGSMVESNQVKTEQCTAVLPTNEYFRADGNEADNPVSAASTRFLSTFGIASSVVWAAIVVASV